jgi:hypothetical protein
MRLGDLKPGVSDVAFAEQVAANMGHLRSAGLIEGRPLTRRKLALAPPGVGEFHLMIEAKDLAQLEAAFQQVAGPREPTEGFHFGVKSLMQNAAFGLYRDFPDASRSRGEERF